MKFSHFTNGKLKHVTKDISIENEKNLKKYKFFLDNILNYIYITDRLIFIRENDDYIFELNISNKSCSTLFLKKENKEVDIKVLSSEYEVKEKYISFKYKLETDDNEHHIVLETGE